KETDTIEDILAHRPPNVLCFGLMRGAKGIDEAIQLGKKFQEEEQPNKVYITGKLMGSFLLCQRMMTDIFEVKPPAKLRGIMQEELNSHLKEYLKEKGLPSINLNNAKVATIFEDYFQGDYDSFNRFADNL